MAAGEPLSRPQGCPQVLALQVLAVHPRSWPHSQPGSPSEAPSSLPRTFGLQASLLITNGENSPWPQLLSKSREGHSDGNACHCPFLKQTLIFSILLPAYPRPCLTILVPHETCTVHLPHVLHWDGHCRCLESRNQVFCFVSNSP